MPAFVSYLRVRPDGGGQAGAIQAQRQAVDGVLKGGRLVGEFVEIERGLHAARPYLAKAIAACRVYRATLVVGRLVGVLRDAKLLASIRAADVRFVCADMPGANEATLLMIAPVAELERKLMSRRAKEGLAAKARSGTLRSSRSIPDGAGPHR